MSFDPYENSHAEPALREYFVRAAQYARAERATRTEEWLPVPVGAYSPERAGGFPAGLDVWSPRQWPSRAAMRADLLREYDAARAARGTQHDPWTEDFWRGEFLEDLRFLLALTDFTPRPPAYVNVPGFGPDIVRARFRPVLIVPDARLRKIVEVASLIARPSVKSIVSVWLLDAHRGVDSNGRCWTWN